MSRWAVATPHATASTTAAGVLDEGGNAVDAALAAAVTLSVVYPNQCSIGGDLIALVGLPDGTVHAVDGTGRSPTELGPHLLSAGSTGMPVTGALPVTVPGALHAWQCLAERFGSRPLSTALRHGADLAATGVPVAPGVARDLKREEDRLGMDDGMRAVFFRDGKVLGAGDALMQPRLAESLATLAGGVDAFYRGDLGRHVVDTLRRHGSPIRARDLADHETTVCSPIGTTYTGEEYLTAPPACQGPFFLEALAALEILRSDDGGQLDPTGADAGLVAAVLAHATEDRDALLGDPAHTDLDMEALLNQRARAIATASRDRRTARLAHHPPGSGDTVAIVATDRSGGWVSLIQSVFHAFGSGILDPATGIVLHNRGASFSLDESSPNLLIGGRRPAHTLMPVLVRRDGHLVGAHGTMGGLAQPQIHAQIALHLARGSNADEAVAAPRWVLGALEAGEDQPDLTVANVETDASSVALERLADRFTVTDLPAKDDGAGHVQLVRRTSTSLTAATDPRADGVALVGGSSAEDGDD